VYKVRNTISDRVEALKVLHPGASEASELASRFTREIKLVASLDHPNIAQLRTALRAGNQLLMIMEFVEGLSLDQRMRQGKIELWRSLEYISQVLAALGYAHRQGVVHRDIKPQNILVTPRDVVKLTDFGIARKKGDPRQTAAGATVGTAYYMSPEQVKAEEPDGRSDLYSVGVTLYEMTTGQRPIRGDTFYAVMHAHLEQIPTPPHELSPEISPALSSIILRSLQKDPAARFQTAEEYRQALVSITSETAPIAVFRPPPSAAPVRTRAVAAAADSLRDSPSGASSAPGWDPVLIDKVRSELAVYIGPLAKIIVNRASKKAKTAAELYSLVAPEIPTETDRRRFLAACPR
jgi:eukaryotic-like serine/threonine-protein kinase